MRKNKFYFGKNKLPHKLGRLDSKWVVPRLLREYFSLRTGCGMLAQIKKIEINSQYGNTFKTQPDTFEKVGSTILECRRMLNNAYLGKTSIPEMRLLLCKPAA